MEASEIKAYHSPLGRMRMLGGAPALDFANTLHWRDGSLADFIADFSSLPRWCVPAGLLSESEATAILRQASQHKATAAHVHRRVLRLREALKKWLIVSAANLNAGKEPTLANTRAIKMAIVEAVGKKPFNALLDLTPMQNSELLNLPLLRCAGAIAALILFPLGGDIRQCEADQCGGFFINLSRSKPRRWCSMEGCGNRAKATRFRQARSHPPIVA